MSELQATPLYEEHVRLNAKLVPFAGFAMPVQYPPGIRAEHEAVRSRVGLFDVSHMGEFRVRGTDALRFVSHVTTNDPRSLESGHAQYTAMCLPEGGIVDDLLVYRLDDQDVRLVVNAANIRKDWKHLRSRATPYEVEMEDESAQIALIALQGPLTGDVLQPLTSVGLEGIGYYHFAVGEVAGAAALISRTGYTGEDGFELYVAAGSAVAVWRALEAEGAPAGLTPAGLGARDTLRLEMGYALYGNDIDEHTSPLEAGLGWLVKLGKGEFVGREALLRQKAEGVSRRLRGFRLTERGFPRSGYELRFRGQPTGPVRSGTMSPSLGCGIGTAYLPPDASPGEPVQVLIRGREVAAEVARMPFYREGSLRK
ncbi:MAG: glycine cleavage system aminomethyltransferase GcvT [Gemmatimonadota bacterium]